MKYLSAISKNIHAVACIFLLFSCTIELPQDSGSTEWVIEPIQCPMYIQASNTPEQITKYSIYIYSDYVQIKAVSSCDHDYLQQFLDYDNFWSWNNPSPGIINVYRNGEWLISNEVIIYDNL